MKYIIDPFPIQCYIDYYDLTLDELAERCDISYNTLNKILCYKNVNKK